jgi:hypothetical protein
MNSVWLIRERVLLCEAQRVSRLHTCLQGDAWPEHTRSVSMPITKRLMIASALTLLLSCSRGSHKPQSELAISRSALPTSNPSYSGANEPQDKVVAPTRLVSLPVSAYSTFLGLDGELAYLFTRTAAYCLAPGKPPQKIELDLGIGPVLADSGIVFWSKGAIWNASKDGSAVWRVAALSRQPEYFVASSAGIAWLDRAEDSLFRIQSLDGQKPRVLVADQGEISALNMVHDWVFFVLRAKDNSWRIGRVHVARGEPQYTDSRTGPTPAMLAGTEDVVYYHMDRSEIRQLSLDLKSEHVWLKDFVCSPIWEATNIYCARVEGLFKVVATSRQAKFLWSGRRETVTMIRANSKQVVWTVDTGPDQLAVDMLRVE